MNAEAEMNTGDGLGTTLEPPEGCTGAVVYDRDNRPSIQHDAGTCPVHENAGTRGQRELRDLAAEIGYSDGADGDDEGGVDALIDYKNALEDRLCALIDSRPANGVDAIVQEAGEIIATRGEVEDVPKLIEEIEEHYPDELYASFIAPGIDRMEEALKARAEGNEAER